MVFFLAKNPSELIFWHIFFFFPSFFPPPDLAESTCHKVSEVLGNTKFDVEPEHFGLCYKVWAGWD